MDHLLHHFIIHVASYRWAGMDGVIDLFCVATGWTFVGVAWHLGNPEVDLWRPLNQ